MDPEREKGENYERSLLLSTQGGSPQRHTGKRRVIVILFLVLAVAIVLGLGVGLGLGLRNQPSSSGTYKTAAVATDAVRCSQIGVDVLKRNGSAVDAAIASLLCTGVVNLHSTGIGGGGFMVYYNASSGETSAFDYREIAPAAATIELFNNSAKDATLRGEVNTRRGVWFTTCMMEVTKQRNFNWNCRRSSSCSAGRSQGV